MSLRQASALIEANMLSEIVHAIHLRQKVGMGSPSVIKASAVIGRDSIIIIPRTLESR